MSRSKKNPFELQGSDIENLGYIEPQNQSFSAEGYSEGSVDEDVISEVMSEFGDDQVFHDAPYLAGILAENTDSRLLEQVEEGEITAPVAPAVYEAITESDYPVVRVEVDCNAPIDTSDHLNSVREDLGGSAKKEIFRAEDSQEPAVEIRLEYGVPNTGQDYIEQINGQNASEFAGVLGTHPQDGNLIQRAEADFAMTRGKKSVSRKAEEPVYTSEEFSITPNVYLTKGEDGKTSEIKFDLVETNPEIMETVLQQYSELLEEKQVEGTTNTPKELEEEVERLQNLLEPKHNSFISLWAKTAKIPVEASRAYMEALKPPN